MNSSRLDLTKRNFIKIGLGGSAALLFSRCAAHKTNTPSLDIQNQNNDFINKFGPIDRSMGDTSPKTYSGDSNILPHHILWDIKSYLSSRKIESVENANVVIVGGGVSGLFSAYNLRSKNPIVLEQAARLGGNAKGSSWNGLEFSIGSAYIDMPRHGTPMHDYYQKLSLENILVERKSSDPVEYRGKLYQNFWEGESDLVHQDSYKKLSAFFTELCEEKKRPFPFIPALNSGHLESAKYYDQYNLHSLAEKICGGKIPEQLETALEYYCWSTYAASSQELSASAALNFLAQESVPIRVPTAGNSKIAERVLEHTLREVSASNFRTGSIVVNVAVHENGVRVLYEDATGVLRAIESKAVVMACPKFIALKLMDGLEEKRIESIKKIKYRSYMVANLLLKKRPPGKFYDLFMINQGKIDLKNIKKSQDKMNATDFVMANFAGKLSPEKDQEMSVLTFYRAFPFEGARAELFQADSYANYKRKFEDQITKRIMPLMGFRHNDIVDLRLTLWGHALPVAAQGLYSDNTVEWLRKPFKERVFFIEQDNWAYPSLQTGATESALFSKQILSRIS